MPALIVPTVMAQWLTVAVPCTVSGSGDATQLLRRHSEQFHHEIDFLHRKWPEVQKYLVYFQNFTNTHARLRL